MNKITLIGNLTAAPEESVTPSGKRLCRFSIAVNRRFQTAENGDKITDFFRITVWNQLAENCIRYLEKGKKVAVVGELQASLYKDKNNEAHLSLNVTADEVEFLSPKSEGEAPNIPETVTATNRAPSNEQGFIDVDDDTLPF